MSRLFEAVLNEADKSRFITKLFSKVGGYVGIRDILEEYGEKYVKVPSADELTTWVNSGAADKYHLDWNIVEKYGEYDDEFREFCISIVKDWNTSMTAKVKVSKNLFKDTSKYHYITENDKAIFVSPLSWEACVELDSFNVGGYGAKWCIGWQMSDQYWENYVNRNKDMFIFVIMKDKKLYGTGAVKFMMQLISPKSYKNYKQWKIWRQNDDPDNLLPQDEAEVMFGIKLESLLSLYTYDDFFKDTHANSFGEITEIDYEDFKVNPQKFSVPEGPGYNSTVLTIKNVGQFFDYGLVISQCENLEALGEIDIAGHGDLYLRDLFACPTRTNGITNIDALDHFPPIKFKGYSRVDIVRIDDCIRRRHHLIMTNDQTSKLRIGRLFLKDLQQVEKFDRLDIITGNHDNYRIGRVYWLINDREAFADEQVLDWEEYYLGDPFTCTYVQPTMQDEFKEYAFGTNPDIVYIDYSSSDICDDEEENLCGSQLRKLEKSVVVRICNAMNRSIHVPKGLKNVRFEFYNCKDDWVFVDDETEKYLDLAHFPLPETVELKYE